MELILVRHAEAEDGVNDFSRKLTPKGRKEAEKIAKFIKKKIKDFKVYSSPLVRAKETASFFLKEIEILDELEPDSTPESFLREISKFGEDETLICVGHQPLIGAIAGKILGLNYSLKTKKAGIWWFKGSPPKDFELYCAVNPSVI
ncbi:MAG: histidine phosphatase family protein [Thermoanaerobaculaceae bacterium]|nr:histidine phosphatase family protein [Thermoanaerobaculaceae bacterium]